MNAPLTGGCVCGEIQYSVAGAPKFAFWCQCRSCQKLTGSDHATGFGVDAENLTVTGELTHYDRVAVSGKTVRTYFCPSCHAPLYNDPEIAPGLVMVHIGSLDDPSTVTPHLVFHKDERIPWDVIDLQEPN